MAMSNGESLVIEPVIEDHEERAERRAKPPGERAIAVANAAVT